MSFMLYYFIATAVAAIVCVALLLWLLRYADALPMDHPNERSLHSRPIPRIGGLGLVPAAIVVWLIGSSMSSGGLAPDALALTAGALLLFMVSMRDDQAGLPVALRLTLHFLVAASLVMWLSGNWLFVLFGTIALAWTINLFNFMDGANGLAGGMATIGFLAYGLAIPESAGVALLAYAFAGAAVGFLFFNFDPARMFLGDAGSVPLGFLAGGMGLVGLINDWWPAWFPLLVFSPFIVDATVTLARRGWRRQRIWEAHREHYYQRLVRMGWSHRRLALCEYAAMLSAATAALALLRTDSATRAAGLIAGGIVFALLMFAIDRRWNDLGGTA